MHYDKEIANQKETFICLTKSQSKAEHTFYRPLMNLGKFLAARKAACKEH